MSRDKNRFLIALSESPRTDFGKVDFADQNEAQRVFTAIWHLESEVNNGGFDQFLRNIDSEVIAHAPVALREIGAATCAGIVESALRSIEPLPGTKPGRYEALDLLDETARACLEALDQEFFAYPDDLTELLYAFVMQHPDYFGQVPS
jgi:hypothetical protein